jgi:lysozyme
MPFRPRILVRRLRLMAALLLLAALLGFCGWMWAAHWRPRVTDFAVQGVDVSEDDDFIDWWAVHNAGARFAYSVATVGADHRDIRFPENWRNSFEAGLKRGAVHVYSLCQLASDQAGNFVSTVARSDDQLPPAVVFDFRDDCPARPDRSVTLGEISRFLAAIERHLGTRAVLKISKAFDSHYRLSEATTRQLWATQPFFPPGYFTRPWVLWQASGFRRVDGVEKPLNWDVMAR